MSIYIIVKTVTKFNEERALQLIFKQGKNVILNKYIHNIITNDNDKHEIEKLVKPIKCEDGNLNIKKLQLSY